MANVLNTCLQLYLVETCAGPASAGRVRRGTVRGERRTAIVGVGRQGPGPEEDGEGRRRG